MGRHQKYLRIFLSFVLAISPIFLINQANATLVGGWDLHNPVADGARTVYQATKNALINGKNVVKTSSIAIAPTAAEVAKVLARGGATLALSVAVEQLLGAVDWVLDPANNQIVYYEQPNPANSLQYVWYVRLTTNICFDESSCLSAVKANEDYQQTQGVPWGNYVIYDKCTLTTSKMTCTGKSRGSGDFRSFDLPKTLNPNYDPNAQREKKTLPLPTVASKVISNAEGDTDKKAAAQVATMAAAADIVNDAQSDPTKAPPISTALDKNASTATDETSTGTATQTDPTTGETKTTDLSLEFPTFCGWAPTVCEAAQTVISFPTTLTNWWDTATSSISEAWTFAKDWATSEPEADTNLDIDTSEESEPNTDISFSTSCPAKIPLQFNWNGQSLDFSFDFTIWCQAISTYVYPIVVTLGSLHALYIVTGVRQDG